jgi:hypothetical protein
MEIVGFPLEHGGQVLVRVDTVDTLGGVVTRGGKERLEQAQQTFEAALGTIRDVAQGVLSQLAGLAVAPETVRVEFGLELTAKAGALLVAAGSTAQLQVEFTWRPHRADGSDRTPDDTADEQRPRQVDARADVASMTGPSGGQHG